MLATKLKLLSFAVGLGLFLSGCESSSVTGDSGQSASRNTGIEMSDDYTVTAFKTDSAPEVSSTDIAQTAYLRSSATGNYDAPSEHEALFNGSIGGGDSNINDDDVVQIDAETSITVDFDLSDQPDGIDIWGINTFFGWNPTQGGRSNQGYSITFTSVDNSTKTIDAQHWQPNSPALYWTVVSVEAGRNGAIASGVKSITFDMSENANAGTWVVAREIDIFDSPSEAGFVGYSMAVQPPNGVKVPKIVGATGDLALLTGYDYFNWYGITEHRTWFKPAFSSLQDNSAVRTAEDFIVASEAIRQDPTRQATANDQFIDWALFNDQVDRNEITERVNHLLSRDIMPMITNTNSVADIDDGWVNKFAYWRQWYTMVYYFASRYDITVYQMRNEPNHNGADYTAWESHWITSADAMRKAMDDVNRDFGKSLELNLAGPVTPGFYWDTSLPHPDIDIHSWGNVSWEKVKVDVFGDYDANNPLNYNSYDYHRYGLPASRTQDILLNGREGLRNADNDPQPDIPIIISEFNTSTGGSFDNNEEDTEQLRHGVSMAAILESVSVHGEDGVGDDGGFFIFKLGAVQRSDEPLVGLGNKLSYVSRNEPFNYGGVTRGGATFQMFARHFRDGKPLLPVVALSGETNGQRTMAAFDEPNGMYYIYGSTTEGTGTGVSIDVNALNVASGDTATLQRVDEFNTGQITELLTVSNSRELSFLSPDNTAFLIKLPVARSLADKVVLAPSDDTTQAVSSSASQGNSSTMNVSMHHSDADKREAALIRFRGDYENAGQALLKITGRNTGTDRNEREIVHVYAVQNEDWDEGANRAWVDAPGLGRYYITQDSKGVADGTGDMVDIEDNYGGHTSGVGTGLGIDGEFVGAVSFHSSEFVDNYLDVTDYINTGSNGGESLDVTFVVVRIVRYNVNEYSNSYYDLGEYHYDDRVVEIAAKEHSDAALRPALILSSVSSFVDDGGTSQGDTVVRIEKVNQNVSIDTNAGATNRQDVFLFSSNASSRSQQWVEINRNNGFYSYQKSGTNHCLDGGNGGANGQSVYLWTCNVVHQNQQWRKVPVSSGAFRLEKRNAPGFSIDGGAGGLNNQNLYLWDSSDSNVNQQWNFTELN